jgi:hypothetical protein
MTMVRESLWYQEVCAVHSCANKVPAYVGHNFIPHLFSTNKNTDSVDELACIDCLQAFRRNAARKRRVWYFGHMHSSRLYVDDTRNTTGAIITRMTVRFELQGNLRCCCCLPLHVIMITNPSQRFGQYTRDAERGMHQFNMRRCPKSSPGVRKTCAANHLHCELLAPCTKYCYRIWVSWDLFQGWRTVPWTE